MKYVDYPFKNHKTVKLFALLFLIAGIACFVVSAFFYLPTTDIQRNIQIVLGVLFDVFGIFFLIDSFYTFHHKTIADENGIEEQKMLSSKKIKYGNDCEVLLEETTTSISSRICLDIKCKEKEIVYSYPVQDYTVDELEMFYLTFVAPMKEKGCKITYSPLLKKIFRVIDQKENPSKYSKKSTENLFLDFKPEDKTEIKERRKKKTISLGIIFLVLEAMSVFLLIMTIVSAIKKETDVLSANDIIFIILYSILVIFIAIYMSYMIFRTNHKKDDELTSGNDESKKR